MTTKVLHPIGNHPVISITDKYFYCLLSRVLESNGCFVRDLRLCHDPAGYAAQLNWVSRCNESVGTEYINLVAQPQNDDIPFSSKFDEALVRYEHKDYSIISEPQIVYLIKYAYGEKGPYTLYCTEKEK